MGTGKSGAGGSQQTRGMNGITGMEQLGEPMKLEILTCACRGPWQGGFSHPNRRGMFPLTCFCSS